MTVQLVQNLILILVAFTLYYVLHFARWIWRLRIIGQAVDQFPMDEKHWLKGHLHKLSGQGEEGLSYLYELAQKYPKACGLYLINFLNPYVVVHHPETVKVVLKAAGRKPKVYSYTINWLGDGLLCSNGKKWHRNRKLLTPTFNFESLKHYIKYNNKATDIFLDKLTTFAKTRDSFEIISFASNLSLDIILRCIFSYESDLQIKGENHFYTKAITELARLWIKRQFEPWKHLDIIYWSTKDGKAFSKNCDLINDFAVNMIMERRHLMTNAPDEADKYHDFLDTLLRSKDADGVGLSDDEIKDEVNTFTAAGYETTSSAISWALYNLALHPDHQKMCQKEIDTLTKTSTDDYMCWNDLQELPYLTKCIQESMRLCGVPYVERELEEDVFVDGKFVPAGSVVIIVLKNLHTHPQIWNNPLKFDPERFSHEKLLDMDSFAYIPFSAGLRNCIGQAFAMNEIKVVLARSLKRFNFTVKENFKPQRIMAVTLNSSNGIHLKVSERTE